MSWKVGDEEWLAPPTASADAARANGPVDTLDQRVLEAMGARDTVAVAPPIAQAPSEAAPPVADYALTSDDLPPPPYSAAFDTHDDDAPPSYESGSFVADPELTDDSETSESDAESPSEPDFHIPTLSLSATPPAQEREPARMISGSLGSSRMDSEPEPSPEPAQQLPVADAPAASIAESVYDDDDESPPVIPSLVAPSSEPTLEVEIEPTATGIRFPRDEADTAAYGPPEDPQFVIPTLARPEPDELRADVDSPIEPDDDDVVVIPSLLFTPAVEAPAAEHPETEAESADDDLHEVDPEAIESLDAADLEELEQLEPVAGEIITPGSPPPAAPTPVATSVDVAEPRPPTPPEPTKRRKAWYDDVFAEHFLYLYPQTWEQTCERDAQFMHSVLGEPVGASILDIGCGDGRHAVELAKLGARVTGLDSSLAMLLAAAQTRDAAELEEGRVEFIHGDMRRLPRDREFDAVVCVGTTLGYFEEDQNWACLQEMHDRLVPGGRLLIHVFNRDFIAPHLPSRSWWQGKRCMVIDEAEMNFFANRLRVHRTVIFDDGRQYEHYMFMRAYTVQDLGKAISQLGMRVLEVSGSRDTRGRFYGSASPDIWIVAEKK